MSLPSALGPDCVGVRVVVRRVLRGQTGPSGGPALTDVLGVMESWGRGVTTIRTATGKVVSIAVADIVSGKPVPPRASTVSRLSPEEVEVRALASWPPVASRALGDWVLRASGGYTARANSVLAVGDPPSEPVEGVRSFYDSHGLPSWAQVVVGSRSHRFLEDARWVPARPGEEDTRFQFASVARAVRAARGRAPSSEPAFEPVASDAWLANDRRAQTNPVAARAVLEGPDEVGFLSLGSPLVAKGRVVVSTHGADVWAGVSDIWVSPESRGAGLGFAVMAALLDWAAERGAGTAYLQTRGHNPAALALCDRLGFVPHHSYRYLTAP